MRFGFRGRLREKAIRDGKSEATRSKKPGDEVARFMLIALSKLNPGQTRIGSSEKVPL